MMPSKDGPLTMLEPHHYQLLRESAISDSVATSRGYQSAVSKSHLKVLGFADYQCRTPALIIPIWNVHGEIGLYQARPDSPRIRRGKPVKYETPSGARLILDVPPTCRDQLGNPAIPLWITEGSRKVDSAVSHGLCCIGLQGVNGWRGTNTHGGKTALPDWAMIALNGRAVYVAFDSDVMDKAPVALALRSLGAFLGSRGANVRYVRLGKEAGRG